jgi:hypothetical protein
MTRPKTRKAGPEPKAAGRPIGPLALSIREFAEAHNISLDTYFRLRRDGAGPRVMHVGSRTLVSIEAAEAWRREREEAAQKSDNAEKPRAARPEAPGAAAE